MKTSLCMGPVAGMSLLCDLEAVRTCRHLCRSGVLLPMACTCHVLVSIHGPQSLLPPAGTNLSTAGSCGPASELFFMSAKYMVKCACLEGVGEMMWDSRVFFLQQGTQLKTSAPAVNSRFVALRSSCCV
jgi:hypothetical protein